MSNFLIAHSYFCSLNDYAVEWLRFLYQSRSRLCCLIIFDVLDVRPITGVMKIIIYSHGKYIYTYKFIFLSHYIYMLTGRVKWIMYIYIYFFRNKIKSIRTVALHQKYWAICWTLWLGVFPLNIEYLLHVYVTLNVLIRLTWIWNLLPKKFMIDIGQFVDERNYLKVLEKCSCNLKVFAYVSN